MVRPFGSRRSSATTSCSATILGSTMGGHANSSAYREITCQKSRCIEWIPLLTDGHRRRSRAVSGSRIVTSRCRQGAQVDAYFMTERHEQLRREVRAFAETEVRSRLDKMEESREIQQELSRLIARQGWIGVTISREYGGLGLGHLAKTIIIEELARVSGAMGAMVQASQLGVAKILHF